MARGIMAIFTVFFLTVIIIGSNLSIPAQGSEETDDDFYLEIDVQGFIDQLFNQTMMGPIHLDWKTINPADSRVLISIYLGKNGEGWNCLENDIPNMGTFNFDPKAYFLPNGTGYTLRVMAFSMDGRYFDGFLGTYFSILNEDMFDVDVSLTMDNGTVSREMMITWDLIKEPEFISVVLLEILVEGTMEASLSKTIDPETRNIWMDTTSLDLGETYMVRITVTDPYDRAASANTPPFTVDYDLPSVPTFGFIEPSEGNILWNETEISWIPHHDLNVLYNVLSDVYVVNLKTGTRTYITRNHQFPNSRKWDPSTLKRGEYILKMDSWMIDSSYSSSHSINISICDLSQPVIQSFMTTTTHCDTFAHFIWASTSDDQRSLDCFSVHIIYHHPKEGDVIVGTTTSPRDEIWIDTTSLPEGREYFKLRIFNRFYPDLMDEEVIWDITIEHPVAPVISPVTYPTEGDDIMGVAKLSWRTWDLDGDNVRVSLFYSYENGDYVRIDDQHGGYNDHIFWNTTELQSGSYSLKFIAYDSSELNLTDTFTTGHFTVFGKEEPSLRSSMGARSDGDPAKIFLVLAVLLTLLVVSIISLVMIIRHRREQKSLHDSDLDTIPIDRDLVNSCIRMEEEIPTINNALPDLGMTSAPSWDKDLDGENTGNLITNIEDGSVDEALDILGLSVNDEVTMDDLKAYRILEVPSNASEEMIRSSYKKFARRYHPDRFASMSEHLHQKAEEEMRRRNRAKDVLLDPRRRAILDSMLRENESLLIRERGISNDLFKKQ